MVITDVCVCASLIYLCILFKNKVKQDKILLMLINYFFLSLHRQMHSQSHAQGKEPCKGHGTWMSNCHESSESPHKIVVKMVPSTTKDMVRYCLYHWFLSILHHYVTFAISVHACNALKHCSGISCRPIIF